MQDGVYQIGEVPKIVGLPVRTIRHREEVGLAVPSGRSPGGFRLDTGDDVERLRLVKHMKPLAFALDEMREVLGLWGQLTHGAGTETDGPAAECLERYAAVAEEGCAGLRAELGAAREIARWLRREVSGRRAPGTMAR